MMLYIVIALAAALALVLWRWEKTLQRLRIAERERTLYLHDAQNAQVAHNHVKRQLGEAEHALCVWRELQAASLSSPQIKEFLKHHGR